MFNKHTIDSFKMLISGAVGVLLVYAILWVFTQLPPVPLTPKEPEVPAASQSSSASEVEDRRQFDTEDEREAYKMGREAYYGGKDGFDNPFETAPLHWAWDMGRIDAINKEEGPAKRANDAEILKNRRENQ